MDFICILFNDAVSFAKMIMKKYSLHCKNGN